MDYSPILCYNAICGEYAEVHFHIFTPIVFFLQVLLRLTFRNDFAAFFAFYEERVSM